MTALAGEGEEVLVPAIRALPHPLGCLIPARLAGIYCFNAFIHAIQSLLYMVCLLLIFTNVSEYNTISTNDKFVLRIY